MVKKALAGVSLFLLSAHVVLAVNVSPAPTLDIVNFGTADLPFIPPSITTVIGFIIRFLFIVAGLIALLFLLLGGIEWITSGGNKENVDKARQKIQAAVVGLIVVFIVLGIVVLLEQVLDTGFGISKSLEVPQLIKQNP